MSQSVSQSVIRQPGEHRKDTLSSSHVLSKSSLPAAPPTGILPVNHCLCFGVDKDWDLTGSLPGTGVRSVFNIQPANVIRAMDAPVADVEPAINYTVL